MQVHKIKWVFVIPRHTPSQWLAVCFPAIPQWGENSMTQATVICFTEKECTEAVFRTLLRFAPMLHWFTNKMARQTVFATAVGFHGQSCRSDKLHTGKQGSCSLPPHTHSLTVTAGMSVTLTSSAQVNAANMAGAGAWRLCSSKTEESTAHSSQRPEAKMSCSVCLSSVVDTGE